MDYQQIRRKAWSVLDKLRRYEFGEPEQVADAVLRVMATKRALKKKEADAEELYRVMKLETPKLGRFQGDADFFYRIYGLLGELSATELLACFSMANPEGISVSMGLALELASRIRSEAAGDLSVFMPECEKYGEYLPEMLEGHQNARFTLASSREDFCQALKSIFSEVPNVEVVAADIYREDFPGQKFDVIICVPEFYGRLERRKSGFICNQTDLVALQNLLPRVKAEGELIIVLPARVMFAGGSVARLRGHVEDFYRIKEVSDLPPAALPNVGIKTYLFAISTGRTVCVLAKRYEAIGPGKKRVDDCLKLTEQGEPRWLPREEFSRGDEWNIERAFTEEDSEVVAYRLSAVRKEKLGMLAKIERGISAPRADENGEVGMINIANLTETGIAYADIKQDYKLTPRAERYLLKDGDVLVACRGTLLKVAVFEKREGHRYIASGNISVIRPGRELKGAFLKLFLESPVGQKLLGGLQRGTSIVNINYRDLEELVVPVPSLETQALLLDTYAAGSKNYVKKIHEAKAEWEEIKKDVYARLYAKRQG